jgi:ATP-binding cassette subfamily B protein
VKDREEQYHQEQSGSGDAADASLLRRLWSYARVYKIQFLFALVMLPVASAMGLIQPHLLQLAIDDHLTVGRWDGLGTLALVFLATLVIQFTLQSGQFYLMQWVGLRTLSDMRVALFRHVHTLRMAFFHRNPVGRLMTRLTTDVDSLQDAVSGGMITVIADLITLIGIVVILLVKNWRLALITFLCVPLLLGLSIIFRLLMRKAYQVIRIKVARLYAYLQEAVSGMVVVQLFNHEEKSGAEFELINREHRDAQYEQIRWDAMLFAVVETISSVAVALIIWYGCGQALADRVTLGVLVAFVEYVRRFFIPIRDLAQKYAMFQSALASLEKIFALFDNTDRIQSPESPVANDSLEHRIEFKGVWFAYNDENWVLEDVSFTIERREKVAIVGRTGAGKSTVIGLLTRLHDVDRGEITIDGVDIREWDPAVLRRLFATVLQDPFLFSGDVLRNITLDDPNVTVEAALAAARAVNVMPFLERRGEGLHLAIAERGSNLSTGEKQLVAFARALARDPQILILDEATASVDTETEALVQEAVGVLLEGRTSLVIAHRLSTIRTVDKIVVLHNARVAEQGSHEELIKADGLYARLYRLQYELAA